MHCTFLLAHFLLFIIFSSIDAAPNQPDGQNMSPTIFLSEGETISIPGPNLSKRHPNLMLFTCSYGAGHKMATQGIMESLPDCHIQVVDIYQGPLRPLDPLRSISPQLSNEQLYNEMAKKEYNRLLNFMGIVAPKTLQWQRETIENLLISYIAHQKPDMLISCIPLVNPMLLKAAQHLGIPLLVVTTDIDITAFCNGFEDESLICSKKNFRITVPYSKEHWFEKFGKQHPKSIEHVFHYGFGYPTRRAFSESITESDCKQLRLEYDVKSDEHLILVMMGGNTAHAAQIYAQLLLGMTNKEIDRVTGDDLQRNKIHLICLCGDVKQKANHTLMTQLNGLNAVQPNNRVRIQGAPGTTKIAQLVSLPELCTVISKPGGSSVNEMIKKKIPMIYHVSDPPLDWERGNMEYGEARGLGKCFYTSGKIDAKSRQRLVEALAHTFALHKKMSSNNISVPEAKIDFTRNLRAALSEMLLRCN